MGAQHKKFNGLRISILSVLVVLAFLMSGVGVWIIDLENTFAPILKLNASDDPQQNNNSEFNPESVDRYWGTVDGEYDDRDGIRSGGFAERKDKVCYIRTPGELAFMRYVITTSGKASTTENYDGYTFILENDIDLSIASHNVKDENNNSVELHPYWAPIEIDALGTGKNKNIVFDGNGKTITGMKIKYDGITTAKNAGFFASMIGGAVMNVTFKDPEIIYNYNGISVKDDDPNRPTEPSEICIGVIAGEAESTYINNVEIVNPKITFTSDNVNAHNFCVGNAVGKLSLTRKNKETTINTFSPKQWGLDKVKVCKEDAKTPTMTITINKGVETYDNEMGQTVTTNLGKATYGYFGGLVGANVTSKIINSTIQDAVITPVIADDVAGTYYVGGIAGYSTQIAAGETLVVAAGLYNNLVLNVNLGTITDSNTRYWGNLIGQIFMGSWAYNNLVIGATNNSNILWGNVSNSKVVYDVVHNVDHCIGHVLGGFDPYYLVDYAHNDLRHRGSGCAAQYSNEYCSVHQERTGVDRSVKIDNDTYSFGTEEDMSNYNFTFASLSVFNSSVFVTDKKYELAAGAINDSSFFDLMSNVADYKLKSDSSQIKKGLLFNVALPILTYEIGLTVNETNPNGEPLGAEDKLYEAVYQFCRWSTSPLGFGKYFGEKYNITFDSAGFDGEHGYTNETGVGTISTPHFSADNTGVGSDVDVRIVERSYQQLVYPVEDPVCEGYKFLGWKIKGYTSGLTSTIDESNRGLSSLVDENGFYKFDERVSTNRALVAIWKLDQFYINYWYVDPEGKEENRLLNDNTETVTVEGQEVTKHYSYKVSYNDVMPKLENQTSDKGYEFRGWYEDVSAKGIVDELDRHYFLDENGNEINKRMPGRHLDLYTGWEDSFNTLRKTVYDKVYVEYNEHYLDYFDNILGAAYHSAYTAAADAMRDLDKSRTTELLTNLRQNFSILKVEPKKLIYINESEGKFQPAFDPSKKENSCPFLYDKNAYLEYMTIKEQVEKYAKTDPYADLRWDSENERKTKYKDVIDRYVFYYERLNKSFNALALNLKDSVISAGGLSSKEVKDLIARYEDLEARYKELYDTGKYALYDVKELEVAEKEAKDCWVEYSRNLGLKEIKSVVENYATAFSNLKTKNAVSDENNTQNGAKEGGLGISPIVLSVIVVALLAVVTFGYIGFDFGLNKRRVAKNRAAGILPVVEEKSKNDDDDTYI